MNALQKFACAAVVFVSASHPSKADPPFGNHPAYLEPVSRTQIVCQITNARCLQVAAYILDSVSPWIADKGLIDAVVAQNRANAKLTNHDINNLDLSWMDRSNKHLIDSVMNNDVSKMLAAKKRAAHGTIIEVFVFDQYGLNVAQTDPTQDYNQGDEAKYWRTFMTGPGALYVDQPRDDDGRSVSQASLSLTDPATGRAIGGMTVRVDVDRLSK